MSERGTLRIVVEGEDARRFHGQTGEKGNADFSKTPHNYN